MSLRGRGGNVAPTARAAGRPRETLRLRDLDLRGRRLLLRTDLNVPLDAGDVADDARIRAALPAVRSAREAGAKAVIVASHLGRPGGRAERGLSLQPVARALSNLLGAPVRFHPARAGWTPAGAEGAGAEGVHLLENLRFHPGETANDANFAAALAAWGDEYANDAFGAAHRRHASVDACARRFRRAAAGPLLERELEALGGALTAPARPFTAVLGGAKVSDKLGVIAALADCADRILVGGAMAYTFLAAQGIPTGRSRLEPDRLSDARRLLGRAGERLLLPTDHLTAAGPNAAAGEASAGRAIANDEVGLDIGPRTAERWAGVIAEAATVLWNGPLGLFESAPFAGGTNRIARAVAEAADRGAVTIVGGGDSLAAVARAGVASRIGHLSTGGGASLAFLAGDALPGVEALARRPPNH